MLRHTPLRCAALDSGETDSLARRGLEVFKVAEDHARQMLVFCFDGTGNEPSDAGEFKEDQSVSNVLKLHVLLGGNFDESPPKAKQKSFYYNGIGTREGPTRIPLLGKIYAAGRSRLNILVAPTFGDAKRILDEARADFDAHYRQGDAVALFGYSRGAALARKFAAMILGDHPECAVSFLGAFDTVAAMGGIHRKSDKVSSDVVFENGTLNPRIEKAVHLVALDEDRVTFTPTLMNRDPRRPERILEVWFPGVHGDVGGGYWVDGLSDVALAFMISRCKAALGDDIAIAGGDPASIRALFDAHGEALAGLEVDDISVHPQAHAPLHTHGGVQAAVLYQDLRSVHVCDDDEPCADLPTLHVSVQRRFSQLASYRPPALRGLKYRLLFDSGELSPPLEGVSGLRRYRRGAPTLRSEPTGSP